MADQEQEVIRRLMSTGRLAPDEEALIRHAVSQGDAIYSGVSSMLLAEIDALRAQLAACWCKEVAPGSEWGRVCTQLADRLEDARRWAVRLEQLMARETEAAYSLLIGVTSGASVFSAETPTGPATATVVARVRVENWTVGTWQGQPRGAIDCELQVDQEDLGDLVELLGHSPVRLFIAGSYLLPAAEEPHADAG